jgi:hypothetical protein
VLITGHIVNLKVVGVEDVGRVKLLTLAEVHDL